MTMPTCPGQGDLDGVATCKAGADGVHRMVLKVCLDQVTS